jgi:hypothetical protein
MNFLKFYPPGRFPFTIFLSRDVPEKGYSVSAFHLQVVESLQVKQNHPSTRLRSLSLSNDHRKLLMRP